MTGNDRAQLRETVGEAVEESVALELIEELGPMIHGAVNRAMIRWTRIIVVAFVLLAVATALLWRAGDKRDGRSHAQREEAVELICELNAIAQQLIEDPTIKDRLRRQRCEVLLDEVRAAR